MSHFAVIAPPFFSHFRALQALSVALIERGHRVTFIHQADAQRWLSDSRIGFVSVGALSHPPGALSKTLQRAANPGGPLGLRRVIADLSATTDMLCSSVPVVLKDLAIDALLADQMEAAGGVIAEAAGLPWVSVACALPINREVGVPLPVMPFAYGRSPQAEKIQTSSTSVYDWMMKPQRAVIERHAAAFGLTARHALHDCLSPLAQISQTVAEFDFPRQALPAHFHHVGPLRGVTTDSAGASVPLAFPIAANRPLVFASLGTLQGQRFGLFKRIAKACRAADVQLLIAHCGGLSGAQAVALTQYGTTWVTDFAPQSAVLARADAVISHAGLNTVMDALVARTPILALPIAFDQPGVAARVKYAGVGLQASARFASSAVLKRDLQRLLQEPGFGERIDTLGAAVNAAGGTQQAADIVEAAIKTGRPVLAERFQPQAEGRA